jgi:hypothetical protein
MLVRLDDEGNSSSYLFYSRTCTVLILVKRPIELPHA